MKSATVVVVVENVDVLRDSHKLPFLLLLAISSCGVPFRFHPDFCLSFTLEFCLDVWIFELF